MNCIIERGGSEKRMVVTAMFIQIKHNGRYASIDRLGAYAKLPTLAKLPTFVRGRYSLVKTTLNVRGYS